MNNDTLSNTFAALADPTRRGILERLSRGDATVSEIAKPYEMSMAAISKHLKVLDKAGLISRTKEAQWRHCRFQSGPLKNANDWLNKYEKFWAHQLYQLDEYLNSKDLENG